MKKLFIIAVDDEPYALESLELAIKEAVPYTQLSSFQWPEDAIAHVAENTVDIAFLDIEMGTMDGLQLARQIKNLAPNANIIFVTSHPQYANSAFGLRASGYLLKPVSPEDIGDEVNHLRNPIELPDKGIRVQCFGNFEIFVDGKPLLFGRAKAKELLAYLVDRRGAGVSKKEIAAILWEDAEYTRSKQQQLQVFITEMMHRLREAGAADMIIKKSNRYAVDSSRFYCDYYSYIKGDPVAINQYHGEYMTNYSWAELTAAFLMNPQTNT